MPFTAATTKQQKKPNKTFAGNATNKYENELINNLRLQRWMLITAALILVLVLQHLLFPPLPPLLQNHPLVFLLGYAKHSDPKRQCRLSRSL